MKISAFLPCRVGSKRIAAKNIKPFLNGMSLTEVKLRQLVDVEALDEIVVSTDDLAVVEIASLFPKVRVVWRESALCSDLTSIEDLCKHAYHVTSSDFVLWTHVTSPFFGKSDYDEVVSALSSLREASDSIISCNRVGEFLLDEQGALVNGVEGEFSRWPATQNLRPYYAVNSAVFLAPRSSLGEGKRMGNTPHFFETHPLSAIDIDTPDDWNLAQSISQSSLFNESELRIQR